MFGLLFFLMMTGTVLLSLLINTIFLEPYYKTERKNALIRPPMANLDFLLIAFAAAKPAPVTETVDKLISIAEYNRIEPVPVIGKRDIDPEKADELLHIYRNAGFSCFALSAATGEGVEALRQYLRAVSAHPPASGPYYLILSASSRIAVPFSVQ